MAKAETNRASRRRADAPVPGPTLPATLRALRQNADLTLAEVASGTDISPSFLSLVENGKCDITIGRLTRLVQFYGVSIGDILPPHRPADPDIVRTEERRQLHSAAEGIDIFLLTPNRGQGLLSMLLEFEPGAGRREFGRHAGEEFVHVLEGELSLELEGSAPSHLRAGDSAYYAGDRPHLMRNASDTKPLRILCVDSSRQL